MRKELVPGSELLAPFVYEMFTSWGRFPKWNDISENKKRFLTLITSRIIEKVQLENIRRKS